MPPVWMQQATLHNTEMLLRSVAATCIWCCGRAVVAQCGRGSTHRLKLNKVQFWCFFNPFDTVVIGIWAPLPFQMKIKNFSKRHFRVPSGEKRLIKRGSLTCGEVSPGHQDVEITLVQIINLVVHFRPRYSVVPTVQLAVNLLHFVVWEELLVL